MSRMVGVVLVAVDVVMVVVDNIDLLACSMLSLVADLKIIKETEKDNGKVIVEDNKT